MFVHALVAATVDVADSDIDPAGGVLLVTRVSNLSRAGITAEILQQRSIRVGRQSRSTRRSTFNYTVTNGLASSIGSITVIEIPRPTNCSRPSPTRTRLPFARVPPSIFRCSANDSDPDGETLSLVLDPPQNLPAGAGLLFVSGDVLRYLAPSRPETTRRYTRSRDRTDRRRERRSRSPFVRSMRSEQPAGPAAAHRSSARRRIGHRSTSRSPASIRMATRCSCSGPDQSAEGDRDGVGPHTITYQAGDYSTGTDTFTYGVIDALGARATGTVRIGIAAKPAEHRTRSPSLDVVTVRPGVTVSVQVLANDSDPNGSPLRVVSAEPNDAVTKAKVVGDSSTSRRRRPREHRPPLHDRNDTGGQSSGVRQSDRRPEGAARDPDRERHGISPSTTSTTARPSTLTCWPTSSSRTVPRACWGYPCTRATAPPPR